MIVTHVIFVMMKLFIQLSFPSHELGDSIELWCSLRNRSDAIQFSVVRQDGGERLLLLSAPPGTGGSKAKSKKARQATTAMSCLIGLAYRGRSGLK